MSAERDRGFAQRLEAYLAELDCTAQRLSEVSGVSTAAISRYRKGERVPKPAGAHIRKLSAGIAGLSEGVLDEATVADELARAAGGATTDLVAYGHKVRALLAAVGANHNELAHALNFDPSFISRIVSGRRRPSDLHEFTEGVARFVARRATRDTAALETLLGEAWSPAPTYEERVKALALWLDRNTAEPGADPLGRFLQTVDSFDHAALAGSLLPTPDAARADVFPAVHTGTFVGPSGMRDAELAFVASALATGGRSDIVMHSDMPFEEMATDTGFVRTWMSGLGKLLASGRRLIVIHNMARSSHEVLLGLEGWIPFYMTGLVRPFYLHEVQAGPFMHLLRASQDVALQGEAIVGHKEEGRFTVSCDPGEVGYCYQRAQRLLEAARPLMRVVNASDQNGLVLIEQARASQRDGLLLRYTPLGLTNTQVEVAPDRWALITRLQNPTLHFFIEHPALVRALEEFSEKDGELRGR